MAPSHGATTELCDASLACTYPRTFFTSNVGSGRG